MCIYINYYSLTNNNNISKAKHTSPYIIVI